MSVVVLVFVVLTVKQNTYWQGEIPLFERVVRFEKEFARAHILLGRAYYFHKDLDQAVSEYKIGLRIMEGYLKGINSPEKNPFYLGFIKGIHFDLAHCYEEKGNLREAGQEYEKALAVDPEDSVLHNNLGVNYIRLENFERASVHFKKAVELNPGDLMARNNLALCQIHQGNLREAKAMLQEILKLDERFVPARQNLEKLKNQIP